MKHLALGLLIGLLILPLALGIFLLVGRVPVAVSDKANKWEEMFLRRSQQQRIVKEVPKSVPIEPTAFNLKSGMQVYRSQCTSCHGLYGQPSTFGAHMYPTPPELWKLQKGGVVGVSDQPVGEIYWKIANGSRMTGMPSFKGVLSETQMWQVSLLLQNANKPLPFEVLEWLKKPLPQEPLPIVGPVTAPDMPDLPQLPKLPGVVVSPAK